MEIVKWTAVIEMKSTKKSPTGHSGVYLDVVRVRFQIPHLGSKFIKGLSS